MEQKKITYEEKMLKTMKHYSKSFDSFFATSELQFLSGLNFYAANAALEELESKGIITLKEKGNYRYWKLNQKNKGESVK